MSISRKRFRPLDPAEERSIHTTQRLHIGVLQDERSYCFSWPEAPLSVLLTGATGYHLLGTESGGGGATSIATGGLGHGGGGGGGASSGGAAAATAMVMQPPVYSGETLLFSSAGGPADVSHLVPSCASRFSRGGGGRTIRIDGSTSRCGEGRGAGMNTPLLAPAVAISVFTAPSSLTSVPSSSPPPLVNIPPIAAPVKPHNSNQHGKCIEDAILSLTSEQLAEVSHSGLFFEAEIRSDHQQQQQPQQYRKTEWDVSCGISEGEGDQRQCAETVAAARRRRLLQIETEVLELELRALGESHRTGSALQRLLSISAAVPFIPRVKQEEKRKKREDSVETGEGKRQEATLDEASRGIVYELWLRWRLHSANALTPLEQHQHQHQQQRQESMVRSSSSRLAPYSASLHPWGSPLLPGAYLYDVQHDYFLNPELAPGTAALEQSHAQRNGGGGGSSSSGGEVGGGGASSSLAVLGAGLTGAVGGSNAEWLLTRRRRRGAYNFLRWRIERYTSRRRTSHDNVSGASTGFSGSEDATSGGGGATEAKSSSSAGVMTPQDIAALILKEVLTQPLVDVEMDEARSGTAALQLLECTDLQRETEMWQEWLAKV